MTAAHRRGATREREAAKILATPRVHRQQGESAPDLQPVRLADGTLLQAEVKTRGKLPAWLLGALAQAQRYSPAAVPLVVLSQTGGPAMAVLPLAALARLLGLQPPVMGQQLALV